MRRLPVTPNEAAVPVLLAALDPGDVRIGEQVIPLLLQRRNPDTENELLRRWAEMTDHWKQLIIRRELLVVPLRVQRFKAVGGTRRRPATGVQRLRVWEVLTHFRILSDWNRCTQQGG